MSANWFKTTLLMAAIVALFGVIGGAVGGAQGMVIALLLGGAMNVFAYWNSDKMVLRMYNAQQVDEASSPYLYNMVKELAGRAGLPMPRVYIIDEAQPNAFATGRNSENAAVAATTGILQMLSQRELRGVMAHELAHVQHRDILISTISATMAGAISALANIAMFFGGRDEEGRPANPLASILVALLAPLAASLIQMAISRARVIRGCGGRSPYQRRPPGPGRCPGQDRCLRPGHSHVGGGGPSGNGPDDDHESPVGRWSGRTVFHPSGDRRTHCAAASAGPLTIPKRNRAVFTALFHVKHPAAFAGFVPRETSLTPCPVEQSGQPAPCLNQPSICDCLGLPAVMFIQYRHLIAVDTGINPGACQLQ